MACDSPRLFRSRDGIFGKIMAQLCNLASLNGTIQVAIFAVVGVSGINPAQIGLVLTYTSHYYIRVSLSLPLTSQCILAQLTQMCGLLTRQTAEVEVRSSRLVYTTCV